MNFRLSRLTTFCGLLLFSSSSWSFFNNCCPEPYFGVDAQLRHMKWSSTNGNNIFNRNLPQGNIYAGLKLNYFLGAEIGYEAAPRRHRSLTINAGDYILGVPILNEDGPPLYIDSSIESKGVHLNLIGFYPIFCDKAELFGSCGFVNLKLRHSIANIVNGIASVDGDSTIRTFEKQRWVPRYGLGVRQMITDCVGIRTMFIWQKLTRFQNMPPLATESLTSLARVNSKYSLIYSFGLFIYF